MKRFLFSAAIPALCLFFLLVVSRPTISNARQETPQEESVIVRDLVMLGPASQGLKAAGFNPSGTVKSLSDGRRSWYR